MVYGVQQYLSYIMVEENWKTLRKPPTCRKSLTYLSHIVVSSTPRHEHVGTHNFSGDRH